jgi:hypothetical protein
VMEAGSGVTLVAFDRLVVATADDDEADAGFGEGVGPVDCFDEVLDVELDRAWTKTITLSVS